MTILRRRLGVRKLGISAAAGAVLSAALLLPGSGSGNAAGSSAAGGATIRVTERDFHIATSSASARAGTVTVRIHNAGPDQHELIILPLHRGESPGGLPLRSDGFTVDEEALQNQEPGSITPQQPGGTEALTVHLTPGRYVLFCNMEGHYLAGMHQLLVVR
jgi:uncharacterized cupredoxin-like copper-binding protein